MFRKKAASTSSLLSRKRRLRNKRERFLRLSKKVFLPLTAGVSIVVLVILGLVYYSVAHQPLYISPIVMQVQSTLGIQTHTVSPQEEEAQITRALQSANIPFTEVTSQGDGLYQISLDGNGKVIVTDKKIVAQQIASLQYVLQRLTMEGKRFSRLDLEFDKPVITF